MYKVDRDAQGAATRKLSMVRKVTSTRAGITKGNKASGYVYRPLLINSHRLDKSFKSLGIF